MMKATRTFLAEIAEEKAWIPFRGFEEADGYYGT
jgi:hypothetical protein